MEKRPDLYPVIYAKDLNFVKEFPEWDQPLREKILPKYLRIGEPEYDLIGYLPADLKPILSLAYVYQL